MAQGKREWWWIGTPRWVEAESMRRDAWTGRCGRGGFIATRVTFFGTVVPEKIIRSGLVHAPYE
jgi:hypothetical protein